MIFETGKIYSYSESILSHVFYDVQESLYSWINGSNIGSSSGLVFLSTSEKEARQLCDELSTEDWLRTLARKQQKNICTIYMPYVSLWGVERFAQVREKWVQRLQCLNQLCFPDPSRFLLLCTTVPALMQFTEDKEAFKQQILKVQKGAEYNLDDLIRHLSALSYRESPQVENPGEYSFRGGILDVFSPAQSLPLRLDFFGDELTSLRYFLPTTQISQGETSFAYLCPLWEGPLIAPDPTTLIQRLYDVFIERSWPKDKRDFLTSQLRSIPTFVGHEAYLPLLRSSEHCAFDYLDLRSFALVSVPQIIPLENSYRHFFESFLSECQRDNSSEEPSPSVEECFLAPVKFQDLLGGIPQIAGDGNSVDIINQEQSDPTEARALISELRQKDLEFDVAVDLLRRLLRQKELSIIFAIPGSRDLERVKNLLGFYELNFIELEDLFAKHEKISRDSTCIYLIDSYFPEPLFIKEKQTFILSGSNFFGTGKGPKQSTSAQKFRQLASEMRDLSPGDLVVHYHFGIGRYMGLSTLKILDEDYDLMNLEYRDGDKLYIPIDRISLVQKFSSGSSGHSLDKLGGETWERKVKKAQKDAAEIAAKLLVAEAKRKVVQKPGYGPPNETYLKFEADFAYVETEDQLAAINDIESDFQKDGLMDRLVCGDVGFGKTEVAMRAAMRTVLEGFQVIVLTPTTVLCYQHLNTFRQRLEKFGVRVEQVNRFVGSNDLKRTINEFALGKIDILVGTHRVLSPDVLPQSLGLIIVDEEQRFGVGHKEKIKTLKTQCHVLTLSATPIPRTLNMALMGLRDMSLIATPPSARLPIHTYVLPFNMAFIREAIYREIRRGGQVFYVHNRIKDMAAILRLLNGEMPDIRFGYIHGGLAADTLERTLVQFVKKEFHVLVTTTIIESGVDMPSVNTLIVEHADRFGLAELHQLRGRVGRSSQQAYCYLTTRREGLTEEAHERLTTLVNYQDLGMGYHVASRDLEIRGAGEILGEGQSGHAAGVGVDFYLELLRKKISELRGEPSDIDIEPEIKLPIPAHIPKEYIKAENIRLSYYKALFMALDENRIEALRHEIRDRFGPLPKEMEILLRIALLKSLMRQARITSISTISLKEYELEFSLANSRQGSDVISLANSQPAHYKIVANNRLRLLLGLPTKHLEKKPEVILDELLRRIDPLVPVR